MSAPAPAGGSARVCATCGVPVTSRAARRIGGAAARLYCVACAARQTVTPDEWRCDELRAALGSRPALRAYLERRARTLGLTIDALLAILTRDR